MTSVLKACVGMKSCYLGELAHGKILKFGFLIVIFVGNTLIAMYPAIDNMEAERLFFYEIYASHPN